MIFYVPPYLSAACMIGEGRRNCRCLQSSNKSRHRFHGRARLASHDGVVGTDEASVAAAGNNLARSGGGQGVVKDGRVIGKVELKIAGLMSTEKAGTVAKKAESILRGFQSCGCMLHNPNMQLSLLALEVIPELRISDRGLVDVTQFKFIPVLEG